MELPFQQYFDLMPCYVTVQNRDFEILVANRKFRSDFGDFQGRCCYQMYKRRSERCEHCPVEKTFWDGLSHDSEESVTCLNGRQVQVIVYTTPIRDEAGNITAVMEMSTDITHVKTLQDQFQKSQKRYQTLFETVPCYISIQDRNLRIIEANRAHRDAFGTHLGRYCYEIYKHRAEPCLPCVVQDTFHDGQIHLHEEVVASQGGEPMNVMVYTAPILNARGDVESVMEMSANITQVRQLQSQLTSIGMLISTLSHGIKGVLTGLDGGVYMVNTGIKKDDKARIEKGWDMVTRNVDRIRSMVFDLLYYAKERELERQPVSASAVAQEVFNLLADRAARLNVAFKKSFGDGEDEFSADPKAIRSMLVNLLENALDACRTDQKKEHHEVGFNVYREEQEIVFRVSDNGIGMDREAKEKVFSLFFSSKGSSGTGLGLFIAHKIAMKHGGRIEIESTPGHGTCFWVRIPVAGAAGPPIAAGS